jgi:hypothetical protein
LIVPKDDELSTTVGKYLAEGWNIVGYSAESNIRTILMQDGVGLIEVGFDRFPPKLRFITIISE